MAKVDVHLGRSLRATVEAGDHQYFADEPIEAGGENAGPDPYSLLLSGLGSCIAMTLRLYADRKGWDLESVSVHLEHARQHKKDCEDCTGDEPGPFIDRINTSVRITGELDVDQRARLGEIAARCPVHRTLANQPKLLTRLEPAG